MSFSNKRHPLQVKTTHVRRPKEDIRTLRKETKQIYDGFISTYSKILEETIYFTSEGFNHLIYESNRKPRNVNEQFLKLKCVCYAPRVIERCKMITETRQTKRLVDGKAKDVIQYELVHEVVEGKAFKVVVEKVGTGKHKFHSVMPAKVTKKRPKGRS
jgi:hypothetical protein